MDEFAKHSGSYQLDQEILDARGINMRVEEVAGLSTCKYSARVQSLNLGENDLAFLKGLRRRIKNRLASQNSRRRSMEHLRRLARELRAVRACRDDALSERSDLLARRDHIRAHCVKLRRHLVQVLRERSDPSIVPEGEIEIEESHTDPSTKSPRTVETKTLNFNNRLVEPKSLHKLEREYADELETDLKIFECRIDKLVQQSVNHIYKEKEKKKISAKTIFITEKSIKVRDLDAVKNECEVLNLSVREGRRRSHGRKQPAPRRITYVYADNDDGVLDLKIKKEPQ